MAENNDHKVRPGIISLALLIGFKLFYKFIEKISLNFWEYLSKECELHTGVGFCFCIVTQTYRILSGPTPNFLT